MVLVEKKKNLDQYAVNETVDDVFVLAEKRGISEYKKGYSFELKLQDAGGYISLKFWGSENEEDVRKIYDSLKVNGVVRVKSRIGQYNEKRQMSVNNPEQISEIEKGSYDPSEFIRKSKADKELLLGELKSFIATIQNEEIKLAVESFYNDPQFIKEFVNCPGAMRKHHGWLGGLLEHTISVTKICLAAYELHKDLDKDLLIAGALLHDVGKTQELETTTRIYYSSEGNLIGHIVLGVQMLTRHLDKLEISDETKQKLIHMVVSHHGTNEFGSPVTPCFPEAIVVHKADELDSKTVQMFEEIKEKQMVSEEAFQWSRDFGRIKVR